MILKLEDEWKEPHSLKEAFIEAMRGPQKDRGNPPAEFDIKDLPIGQDVKIEKPSHKC